MIRIHGPAVSDSIPETKLPEINGHDSKLSAALGFDSNSTETNNNELVKETMDEKSTSSTKTCIPRKISIKSMDKIDVEKRAANAEVDRTRA